MDADVLGDIVGRDRRSTEPALRAPGAGRLYDYRRFCTNAWKVGNFLRHLGVRGGDGVAIADDPAPEAVLTLYGAALLGAVVRFGPSTDPGDVRALVVPASALGAHEVGPSTKPVVYGDAPGDPSVAYFERDVWSENPTMPPDAVTSGDDLLRTADAAYTHGELLDAARTVVDRHGIDAGDDVAVAGSFAEPRTVAAGLLAPILAGAAISIGPDAEGRLVVGGREDDIDAASLL
jgi:hypothetical protein